jgi:prophage antirepressor-like protein
MNAITPFQFESHSVRVVTDEKGDPWFNAADVCAALAYANPRDALSLHVDPDDVGKSDIIDNLGRTQRANHINESGLYALILGSTKPEAKRFKRWVTSEVLPTLRKTGTYSVPTSAPALPGSPQAVKEAFAAGLEIAKLCGFEGNHALLSADRCSREFTGRSALQVIGATLLADPRGRIYTPTDLGKMLDPPQSARKVNLTLAAAGLQAPDVRGAWVPTPTAEGLFEWLDTGKRHSDGTPVKQLKWFEGVLARIGATQ